MSNKNAKSFNGWNVGDICFRKGERCKIKTIDFSTHPPSVVIEVLSDGHEINTEFSKLSKPQTSNEKQQPMDEQTKKDLAEIQQWFLGLSIVKDADLNKLIPSILPKLLFKLNTKQIHKKLQSEILQMISHVSSRINGLDNGYLLIPINAIIKMLYEHISYYNHNKTFYLSPFFINFCLSFIDMAIKNFVKSLHSKHLLTKNQNQRVIYPKLDLNDDNIDDKNGLFINKELILNLFNLLTMIDKFPNNEHSFKVFHAFVQILPFIKYSNDNIDKNAKFFSPLFQINFDKISKEFEAKREQMKKEKEMAQNHKIMKQSYDNNQTQPQNDKNNESDSEEDDDEDEEDGDIEMKEEVQNMDIVQQLAKQRNLDDNLDHITAVILTHKTPISALSHIKMIIDYCAHFLLARHLPKQKDEKVQIPPSPGLSPSIHDKISKHYALLHNKLYLQEMHKAIIDFFYFIGIVCEMIQINEVFVPSLIAANDGNVEYVGKSAQRLFSKIKADVNVENANIIKHLYLLYLGDTNKATRASQRQVPCSIALKIAIIGYLSKSNGACNEFPAAVKVVFDALFGKGTYAKLKLIGLDFTQKIFANAANSKKLIKLTPLFKTGLLKLLRTKQDAPDEYVESEKIRNIAYCTVAQLSSIPNAKKLFTKDLDILKLYFDRLVSEKSSASKEGILDSLKSFRQCFEDNLSDDISKRLLSFLLERMDKKQTSNRSRVVILEWLNDIFPFNNSQIRMVNIFQLSYNDIHIKEYAKKGLLPRINRDSTSPKLLIEKNNAKKETVLRLESYPSCPEFTNIAHLQVIKSNQKISENVIKETIQFAAKCLSANAIIWSQQQNDQIDADKNANNILLKWLESNDETNEFRNESLYKSLSKQSKYVRFKLSQSNDAYTDYVNGFEKYLELILYALDNFLISQSKKETLHSVTIKHLVHFICICYPSLSLKSESSSVSLKGLLEKVLFNDSNLNLFYQRQLKDSNLTRLQCSKLFAMITLLSNNGQIVEQYQSMMFKSITSHLMYQLKLKGNSKKIKPNDLVTGTVQQALEIDGALRGLSCIISAQLTLNERINPKIAEIVWILTIFSLSKNMDLINSSCFCVSMIGKYDIAKLLNKEILSPKSKEIMSIIDVCSIKPTDNDDEISRISNCVSLIEHLTLIIKRYNKNQRHIAESAIQALASIAGGISSMDKLKKIQTYMLELRKFPQEDLQFTIGSVWANIILSADKIDKNNQNLGINQPPAVKKIRIDPSENKEEENDSEKMNEIDKILNQICNDQMSYGNKLARCAGCMWLLCIVRFAGHLKCIQDRLLTIQSAFISSLSDSNEFTVQCASKGLAHCYEMAKKYKQNVDGGDALLKSLMSTLGKGKRKIHKDTEIQHKEGTSTYSELCKIAKDLNQPKLAYRFLDLASNSAVWNSKRGAAFSLGSLLKISDEIRDKMQTIIPVLYRYKFDITPQIRSTMQNLWRSIVNTNKDGYDEETLVQKYYDEIMTNVIAGLQSKEWRIRASTPLAVCALITGKRFNEIKKYLPKLLDNLFLVVQDINSMVKKSSLQMTKSMLNLIERLVDSDLTAPKYVIAALDIIVPIVCDPVKAGIETRAKEVQLLSVTILLKICTNKTGKYLCPHLKQLISILLVGLSTLEPTQLNYLAVQDQGDDFANKVEAARLNIARSNPLNQALNTCIDLIDDIDTINTLIPELAQIIKSGVGLNSLNAACKILNNLSQKKYLHPILRKKNCKKVLTALLGQIQVTNSAHLKSTYAAVIGHWMLFAKKKQAGNAMRMIEDLYFNDDTVSNRNDDKRILAGMIAYNICRFSLSVIKKNNQMMALSFIGTHDLNDECSDFWTKAMDEAGGKQMCLIKNMDVTIKLIIKTFNDSTYSRKQTAIISIKELCKACKDDLNKDLLQQLIEQILGALPGRIWEGKIKLFEALNDISKHCHVIIHKNKVVKNQMIKSLMAEIQRGKKLDYRVAAINAFGEIVNHLNKKASSKDEEISVLDDAMPIMQSIFEDYNKKEQKMIKTTSTVHKEQLEMKEKHKKDKEVLCCALRCIGNVWNGSELIQEKYLSFAIKDSFIYYLKRTDWMPQIAIYKAIQSFVDGLNMNVFVTESRNKELLGILIEGILEGFNDLKYAAIRHQACVALYKLLKNIKDFEKENQIKESLIDKQLCAVVKEKIDFVAKNDKKPIVVQQALKLKKDIFTK